MKKTVYELSVGLTQVIDRLEKMVVNISDQGTIDSFEKGYCMTCKQPCGRSNAEILNCIIEKRKLKENFMQTIDDQYMKEHLEQDLKKIIADLTHYRNDLKMINKEDEN